MKSINKIHYTQIKSFIGPLHLFVDDNSVLGIYFEANFKDSKKAFEGFEIINKKNDVLINLIAQLEEYFCGKRKNFDLATLVSGTDFQKTAWSFLKTIPFGKTVSYSEQAVKTKYSKAVRAIGSANGKNPIPILIPCHRVLRANGELGGYSGGLKIKQQLLNLEAGY